MKSVALKAYPRSQVQHAEVKKLRAAGRVPATIYGRQAKPQNLEVGFDDITDLLHHSASENLLVDLSVENDARAKRLALVQEVQHHPLSGKVLHVDLHEVAENEKVTVSVPVETTGEAAGVKNGGGTLEHVMHKLKVRCLPKDLPEEIVIDVTPLEIGKSVHIGEVVAPAGVEILGEKGRAVVTVTAPRAEEEVAATAAVAVAGDVEMTKEKKEEGAEGAAPAAKGAAPGAKGAAAGAKGDAKAAAPAGDKKAEAKPEAKGGDKKK
jgi:large subunit ribosomal protein L25